MRLVISGRAYTNSATKFMVDTIVVLVWTAIFRFQKGSPSQWLAQRAQKVLGLKSGLGLVLA